jgi:cell division protease FtsH
MMATAVLAFVWLVFFSNPVGTVSIPATNLGNFLQTADIKEITTTERETVTTITGNYLSEEGGTIYFTATFETSNTFIKNQVDEALSNRLINENDPTQGFYYAQIGNTNNAFETTWFDAWGPTIFVVGGSALVFLFIFSRMNSSVNNTNNKALEFNRSRARREDNSKVKFADVAGAEEEKAELVELVEYLKTPAKFTRLGAKLPRGVLLVGPPGTGKTLLAKAVAGEAGVPFFSISGSDFVEMFVGVGAGRVRDMFRQAKRNAPCLIFIDEIDAVGRQRGAGMGGGNDEREQTLNQLLVELDGFADNSGIIVIAATNRDDVLDPALLRAGRFDRQITVNLPDRKGRAAIFAVHSRNKKIDPTVDFDNISKRTVGFSGADIANIMNEAAILAVRSNRELVTIKDIDEAIDRRIAGPAKSSKGMSEHEREVVAYHEAGHAVIGLNLKFSDKVQKITIVPRGRTGGHVMMTPEEDRFLMTKNQLEARIIGYLGGRTSEEIFFGDVSTGAQNDIEVATRIARMMVTEYGMSSLGPIQYESNTGSVFLGRDYNSTQKNFSTQVAFEIDKEVRKIIDNAHEEARKILTEKKQDVILIAKTLLEKETITAEEIQGILNSKPVTEDVKKPRKKKEDKDA